MFTFDRGIKFSFEYPSHYKKDDIWNYIKDKESGGVELLDTKPSDGRWTDFIRITVYDKDGEFVSVNDAVEKLLTRGLTKYDITRQTMSMDRLIGESIGFYYDERIPSAPVGGWGCSIPLKNVNPDGTVTKMTMVAYFEDDSHFWCFEMGNSKSKADQFVINFNHILQTFKIQD